MKASLIFRFIIILSASPLITFAQADSNALALNAVSRAEQFVKAFKYREWERYISLTHPGEVKYYGGRNGYKEFVERARNSYNDVIEEQPEKLSIIQLANNDMGEWQCVIRKTRETYIDARKAKVITYLVGQSKDDGLNWTFVDVSHNTVENMIYIMPDIFANLAIPARRTVLMSDVAARGN